MLQDTDKQDIVAWICGMGTPASNDHARHLVHAQAEAGRYADEIRGISQALRAPDVHESLPSEQAAELARAIASKL